MSPKMDVVLDYGFALDFNLQYVPATLGLDVPDAAAASMLGIGEAELAGYLERRQNEVAAAAHALAAQPGVTAALATLRRRLRRGGSVMAVGDSITAYRRGYVELLRALLAEIYPEDRLQVLNRGQSGYTSNHGLEYTYMLLLAEQPDLVFLMFGANDTKHFGTPQARTLVSLKEYGENMAAMVEAFRAYTSATVVLFTPAPVAQGVTNHLPDFMANHLSWDNADLAACAALVQDLAKRYHLPCVDLFGAFGVVPDPGLFLPDGLHPGPSGQLLMLQTILETIQRRNL